MFRCQVCDQAVGAYVAPHRIVTKTRAVEYPHRSGANRRRSKRGRDDRGGSGWEIAVERLACPTCAARSAPIPLPAAVVAEATERAQAA